MRVFYFFLFLSFLSTPSFSQGLGTYQDFTVNVNNQNRTFKLYTPPGVNPAEPTPVVLVFHGFSGTSGSMIQLTEFYQAADTAGFYVVYPQGQIVQDLLVNAGSNYVWDIPFISTGPNDDLAFVDEIIDTLFNSNSFNIDLNKVYACGFSNGGN
ncbi:MAG: PHB depolymerase family esterase, partial [Saprospiraceae bacterium]